MKMKKLTPIAIVLAASLSIAQESPYASGGEVTTFLSANGHYNVYVHTFTNASAVETFRNIGERALSLRYLVVGGGGAGAKGSAANSGGGGGGGGGVYENAGYELAKGASLDVTVGRGASAVESNAGSNAAGSSILTDNASFTITVPGGGNGAYSTGSNLSLGSSATQGAGGGGGARYAVPEGGGTASSGAMGIYQSSQFGNSPDGTLIGVGFAGGAYFDRRGGGGGGAGSSAKNNRNGGDGLSSDITGETLVYGSGGGGGGMFNVDTTFVRTGGNGGSRAGNGGTYEIVGTVTNICCATAPVANSGCGGGGGLAWGNATAEQQIATGGADGIVVIRYQIPVAPCVGGDIVTKRLIRRTRYSYVHIFTNTAAVASFKNLSGCEVSLRYLVVGAGGAGAKGYYTNSGGGGGGGGGVYEADGYQFANGASLSVTVGRGALVVEDENGSDSAGSSILSDGGAFTVNVPGGGNGAVGKSTTAVSGATKGAAGGGGARYAVPEGGGTAGSGAMGIYQSSQFGNSPDGTLIGVGFAGGAYFDRRGGGGGGAGSSAKNNRNGGDGLSSDITGETLVYGSGGGGGGMFNVDTTFVRTGGNGGSRAGNGGTYEIVGTVTNICCATAPVANSGCGGGGGLAWGNATAEQQIATGGADGIVVIQYEYDPVQRGFVLSLR